jgi:L-asparaginase type I
MKVPKVLIIYTGGTIGMKRTPEGYAPSKGFLLQLMKTYVHQSNEKQRIRTKKDQLIEYEILEYEKLIDSSNMQTQHWIRIAQSIFSNYNKYVGFVILHGTDTMAYTASALSFMLVNLSKPVILTGSQIPISESRSDATENLIGAITLAGSYSIPEVGVYFNNRLFRGNRVKKIDSSGLGAFDSGDYPILAEAKVRFEIFWKNIRRVNANKLILREITTQPIMSLKLFPSIDINIITSILQNPLEGLIIETYGAGNFPSNRIDILDEFQKAIHKGVIIVNCTQCHKGGITKDYAASKSLHNIGVVPGSDMTIETAICKMMYLLSQNDVSKDEIRKLMAVNLRGEISSPPREVSQRGEELLLYLVKQIQQDLSKIQDEKTIEQIKIILICQSIIENRQEDFFDLVNQQIDLNQCNHHGEYPVLLSVIYNRPTLLHYLLQNNCNPNIKDDYGNTPLRLALQNQFSQCIQLLRQNGANVI